MTFIGGYFEKMPTSIQIMSVYECNGKNIFNGTINLSPNENIFIIARILNDQNLMRYDIINNASNFLLRQPIRLLESHYLLKKLH